VEEMEEVVEVEEEEREKRLTFHLDSEVSGGLVWGVQQ
jgi:hypothetical protein